MTKLIAVAQICGCADVYLQDEVVPPHIAAMVSELRARPNGQWGSQERTHPLPVAASWANGGERKGFQGYTTRWQLEQMLDGHYLIPTVPMYDPTRKQYGEDEFQSVIRWLAHVQAPISWRANQPFKDVLDAPYRQLGTADNPRAYTRDENGEPVFSSLISPWAPNWPWYEVGFKWSTTPSAYQLYNLYQNPPLVIFLDNNEAWHTVAARSAYDHEARLAELYGPPDEVTINIRKSLISYGLSCLFRSYLAGIKDGMSEEWRANAVTVAYNSVLSGVGGFDYRERSPDREAENDEKNPFNPLDNTWDWEPMAWDGSSPSYYLHDWDKRLWDFSVRNPRMFVMTMHAVGHRAAFQANPNYFVELSVWDGNGKASDPNEKRDQYTSIVGQEWSAARYKGFIRWGMWIARPQIVREFRGSQVPLDDNFDATMALISAVDEVWENPTLERFWRNSELVSNPDRRHPQYRGPSGFMDVPRMFLLESSTHPDEFRFEDANVSAANTTKIPVWALARKNGDEYLIFADAPLGAVATATITVPGVGAVLLRDIPTGGGFWLEPSGERVE